jgi:hypothetical protein
MMTPGYILRGVLRWFQALPESERAKAFEWVAFCNDALVRENLIEAGSQGDGPPHPKASQLAERLNEALVLPPGFELAVSYRPEYYGPKLSGVYEVRAHYTNGIAQRTCVEQIQEEMLEAARDDVRSELPIYVVRACIRKLFEPLPRE